MELEEIAKRVTLMDLKAEAKKHGIPIVCRTKMDIARDLPKEITEKLVSK